MRLFGRTVHVGDAIAEMREAVAEARRRGDDRLDRRHERPRPKWLDELTGDDDYEVYRASYRETRSLLRHGHLTWVYIVQANTLLFERGRKDLPGSAIFWNPEWPNADRELERLADAARRLHRLKDSPHDFADPRLNTLGAALEDDAAPAINVSVPASVTRTDVDAALYTALVVRRKLLPWGARQLAGMWFPAFVDTTGERSPLPLASAYWHPVFRRWWVQEVRATYT
ncbi:MAG: hypothetical protein AAGE94_04995 [Acidobacteriota bacterium]